MNTINEEDGNIEINHIADVMNYILSFQIEEMKHNDDDNNNNKMDVNEFRYNKLLKLLHENHENHFTTRAVIKQLQEQSDSILNILSETKSALKEIEERLNQSKSVCYSSNSSKKDHQVKTKLKISSKKKNNKIINELKNDSSLPLFYSSKVNLSIDQRIKHIYYILKALKQNEDYYLSPNYYINKDNKSGRALYRRKLKEFIQSFLNRNDLKTSTSRRKSGSFEERRKHDNEWNRCPLTFNIIIKYDRFQKIYFISESCCSKIL